MRIVQRILVALVVLSTAAISSCSTGDTYQQRVRAELKVFTDWLAVNQVQGYIGEFGWPGGGNDSAQWNALADSWFRDADAAGLWTTAWATGEWWGTDYSLAIYGHDDVNMSIDRANTQASVFEAHLSTPAYRRGINVAGGAFSAPSVDPTNAFSNANPGRYDEQYHYDSQVTFDYLNHRGISIVRIECRWERLQPVLGQPLDSAELDRLKAVIGRAGAANLGVILDVHNYGSYYLFDGTQGVRRPIGSPQVSEMRFADLWSRLSAEFRSDSHVVAYDLMNEPTDMIGPYVSTKTLSSWETAVSPWVADNQGSERLNLDTTITHGGMPSLKVTKTLDNRSTTLRIHDNQGGTSALRNLSADGTSFGTWVYLPPNNAGSHWKANLFAYDEQWQSSNSDSINVFPGQWTQILGNFPANVLRSARAIGVQIDSDNANGLVSVYITGFTQGSAGAAARTWENASQTALNAIRANNDPKLIMVSGYNWSHAQDWSTTHPQKWIVDNTNNYRYEAHHYWDPNHTSMYFGSYAEAAVAVTQRVEPP